MKIMMDNETIKLITIVAFMLSMIILSFAISMVYMSILVLILFLYLPLSIEFKLLIPTALFPLGFSGALGLQGLYFFTLLAPLMLFGMLLRKINPIYKPRTKVSVVAWLGVLIILLAFVVSYLRNPAGAKSLFGGLGETYGLKNYYTGVACILVFIVAHFSIRRVTINTFSLLKYIMIFSVIVGILRMLTYFQFFHIPIFLGSLRYLELGGGEEFIIQSRRIGGLDLVAGFSIIPAFILFETQRYKKLAVFGFLSGIAFLVLSGGRSSFIGVACAILVGTLRIGATRFFQMLVILTIAYFALTQITFNSERSLAESQFERILRYEEISERETHRLGGYEQLLNAFMENPLFGKGISAIELDERAGISDIGGHGAYFSLIGLFGLAGIAFLILFIVSPVLAGLNMILRPKYKQLIPKEMLYSIRFMILTLVWMMFIMGAGGSGYGNSYLYLFIGMLTAQLDNAKKYMLSRMHSCSAKAINCR